MSLKVLWLAPLPYIDDTVSHPAPWIMTLANILVENGVELTILNYNSTIKDKIVKKEFQGIKLTYVKTPKLKLDLLTLYQKRIRVMNKYLKTIIKNYNLVHIHGSEHQYEAMMYNLNIPVVISIQGIISEVLKVLPIVPNWKIYIEWKLSSMYEKKYLPRYSNFSCRTHWDSSYIRTMNPKAKVFTIWEMIREDFFEDYFSKNKKSILFVGGKNPIKGLIELLQAFNSSLQKKDLTLIILGNCKVDDLNVLIGKYNLSNININNIDCRGMQGVKGMISAYEESFCLVHPTYIDNSPNSVCEAQLSGLPVIATDVGGVSSLIEDEKTGLLIGKESKDIEISVDRLLSDNHFCNFISKNSKKIARHRHNPDLILKQTLDMYNEIVNGQV